MEDTTAFDKTYFINLAFSFLRHLLTGVGVWFTGANIGTQGQWDHLVYGLASLAIGGALMIWSKYKTRVKFLTALAVPQGSTEARVNEMISAGTGVGQSEQAIPGPPKA